MPLNVRILDALAKKSKSLVALRRAGGSPSTTTMRMHMRTLARAGVVERRGRDGFTNSATFGLTPAGQELLEVAAVLKAWLASAPGPELEFGSVDAAGKVSTLVAGWSAGIVRLLQDHSFADLLGPPSSTRSSRAVTSARWNGSWEG